MNDVKSLHTTKNKNKKFHAYCVKKQFSLYVSSYDVYIKKSIFAIYSYINFLVYTFHFLCLVSWFDKASPVSKRNQFSKSI